MITIYATSMLAAFVLGYLLAYVNCERQRIEAIKRARRAIFSQAIVQETEAAVHSTFLSAAQAVNVANCLDGIVAACANEPMAETEPFAKTLQSVGGLLRKVSSNDVKVATLIEAMLERGRERPDDYDLDHSARLKNTATGKKA